MATTKKQMTDKEVDDAESKLIPILMNEPSDLIELQGGVRIRLKRPTLPVKYRYQVWLAKKITEIGLDPVEDAESEFLFYWTYLGLLNAYIVELILPDSKELYEYDPKVDFNYKFLFEKYIGEEIYNKGVDETSFVLDAIEKYNTWQGEVEITPEELKNS